MNLVFHREGDFDIKLEQYPHSTLFKLTYGKQVMERLTYEQAAHETGEALLHCLACEGKIEVKN